MNEALWHWEWTKKCTVDQKKQVAEKSTQSDPCFMVKNLTTSQAVCGEVVGQEGAPSVSGLETRAGLELICFLHAGGPGPPGVPGTARAQAGTWAGGAFGQEGNPVSVALNSCLGL